MMDMLSERKALDAAREARRVRKIELREQVTADYNERFPRLTGTRLKAMVKQKADMLLAAETKAPAKLQITGEAMENLEQL